MSKRTVSLLAGALVLAGCTAASPTIEAGAGPASSTTSSSVTATTSAAATPSATATTIAVATTVAPASTTAAPPMTTAPPTATSGTGATLPTTVAPAVLELGVVHEWVGFSQARLKALGYGDLVVDQRFGPATHAAVVRFEQVHATTVDGRLDALERLLLLSNAAMANPRLEPVAPPVPQPVSGSIVPAQPPVKLPPPDAGLATPATARTNANCHGIEVEFLRQGAEAAVADQFAYVIAPRESGCVPQLVSTATDLSYSRLGLNFIGSMPVYWGQLCGVTDYRATADLIVDVRCGLAAYLALGWKPWNL